MIQNHSNLQLSPIKVNQDRDCETNASSNGDTPDSSPIPKRHLCRKNMFDRQCSDQPFCLEAHSLPELLKQDTSREMCSSFHNDMICLWGKACRHGHTERSVEEIMAGVWRGNRMRLLTDYPELMLARA
jgi:hypothetical protein